MKSTLLCIASNLVDHYIECFNFESNDKSLAINL